MKRTSNAWDKNTDQLDCNDSCRPDWWERIQGHFFYVPIGCKHDQILVINELAHRDYGCYSFTICQRQYLTSTWKSGGNKHSHKSREVLSSVNYLNQWCACSRTGTFWDFVCTCWVHYSFITIEQITYVMIDQTISIDIQIRHKVSFTLSNFYASINSG